ncbi:MAG: nicotinate-nucleotide adenylyltransferase [Candidatus Cloacimonetes bacterium]|nr:nicotinate-nucleotide adenylyltransferase [Candidatus Cloacimonadota bacterium]
MKLGLLGGAFDPVHYGHLAVARRALEALALDEVLFLPAGSPPHKHDMLSFEVRCELIEAALRRQPHMRVSSLDRFRGDTNYTFHLLERVRKRFPGAELFFLIGDDNVEELQRWHRYREALELARFVVFTRNGRRRWSNLPYIDLLRFVPMEPVPVSSTQIRETLSKGGDISPWVPPSVTDWLQKHGR